MRIVLLALDGEAARAERILRARVPQAEVELLPRAAVEAGGAFERLKALRARRPEAFAVSTERLAWQQGQNALLLFGTLAGARRLILLDAHGGWREERRAAVALRAPARLAREAAASAWAVARARRELKRLESAFAEDAPSSSHRATNYFETSAAQASAPRITYLRATPAAGTISGGSTSHINGFVNAALDAGASISFLSNDRVAGLDEARVSLKIIEPDSLGLTRAVFDLRNSLLFTERAVAEITDAPPDFIYQRYSRFNWAGVEASRRTGRPLFLEYNGSEVWMGRHWDNARLFDLLTRVERLNLRAAARVFVVSEVERRNLEAAGVAEEKIIVNPNGVDVERFRPGTGGARVRDELGVAEDETLVGFVGTFGPWHGVLTLAEAAVALPPQARVRFLLVGSGSLREKVETMLREGGRMERALFTGSVAHERVPALLDACDVLASPHAPLSDGSEFFGSPTKLFEYMAMGKAIVASRLGQIAEVLCDEETALLVEPGDARALKDALLRLAASPELRVRLGASARRVCVARHTWAHNAARVLDAYRSLVKKDDIGYR
ncbi:MAG TPA: glycosyltransferase family 4 protein [Pyrinomonadaceae bacterium]|nr:glycosyltransferase family 4 protein [Pyrinomonadaceae bacterium]